MSWDRRFLASTRGRIVELLRRGERTVDELALELDLTDNAVRAHLATLERDGLIAQAGARRGGGKPAYTYRLTPDAERMYPKAYEPALEALLAVMDERMTPAEVEAALIATGRRLAQGVGSATGDVRARVQAAVDALNALGGLAEIEETEGGYEIRSYGCPLAGVTQGHPEACRLAEAFVSAIAGVPAHERCIREPAPRCRFEVTATG